MRINLNVNNVAATVDVLPDTPLLWVLRDVLNLTAVSYTHLDVYKRQR